METESSRPVSDEEDNTQLFDDDNDNEEPGNPMDEAVEVPVPNEDGTMPKTIKPKRVIKNPQPKLDAVRLMGPRGVGILESTFKDVKFRGKGYEKEDLRLLMKKIEHWAHRLFPKFTFDDSLKQIEKLGSKKNVQNMVKRIRLDMFQSDELNENPENNETSNNDNVPEVDVFDQLLSTGPFAEHSSKTVPYQIEDTSLTFASSQPSTPVSLTEEQRERIAMKRLEALERRRKRLQEQETEKEISISESTQNSITFPIDDATANLTSKDSSSEDKEDKMEDVTTNLASKESSSNDKEDNMEDVTTNLASKESSSNDKEDKMEDSTTNLANKESSSEDKDEMEDATIEIKNF
ncbi:TIMELESS-interacting protein, partial [Armadillidium vulgare]